MMSDEPWDSLSTTVGSSSARFFSHHILIDLLNQKNLSSHRCLLITCFGSGVIGSDSRLKQRGRAAANALYISVSFICRVISTRFRL